MQVRRSLLKLCCATPLAAAYMRAEAVDTECLRPLPEELARHELVARAWDGLDPARVRDVHAHLVGMGDSDSGARADPRGESWRYPVERVRRLVMMSAACVDDAPAGAVDRRYVQRLHMLMEAMPAGVKMLLFAFDHPVGDDGRERPEQSTFFTPDEYAQAVAREHPERFDWVASIHPYREDALARLERALGAGAKAVKWLPSAMNIDPAAPRCDPFYRRLAAADLPLIVHGGEEVAVPGARKAEFNNPLRLRRALEHGVRVVVAHAASLGKARDLDAGGEDGPNVRAFDLFARLMGEHRFERVLFADLSAVFQRNRELEVQRQVLTRREWHSRLLHGSDYPLPGIGFLFSTGRFVDAGWLSARDAAVLDRIRPHNPLLYEFLLKRTLAVNGTALAPAVFQGRQFFARPAA